MINIIFKQFNPIQQNYNLRNRENQQIGFKGNAFAFSAGTISRFKNIMGRIDSNKATDLGAKEALTAFFKYPEFGEAKDKIAQFLNHRETQDWYGGTALHTITRKGYVETAKYLLEQGINSAIKENRHGHTALDVAEIYQKNNPELIKLLKVSNK